MGIFSRFYDLSGMGTSKIRTGKYFPTWLGEQHGTHVSISSREYDYDEGQLLVGYVIFYFTYSFANWIYCTQSNLVTSCAPVRIRSEEHTSELQSRGQLVCRLLHEQKNK